MALDTLTRTLTKADVINMLRRKSPYGAETQKALAEFITRAEIAEPRAATAEEMFLEDLPQGVTLLPDDFEGETTRVVLTFALSQKAVYNENFDAIGFFKAKLHKALTAIRHRRNIKELRLLRRLRAVIYPRDGHKKFQLRFYIDYAKE